MRGHFLLDPEIVFLNHGSFGSCPRAVLDAQQRLRERLELEPVRFFVRELPGLLDEARGRVAAFVGADPRDLVFCRNSTSGVNAVLGSLSLAPGDEILTTDHVYGACAKALEHFAGRARAKVVFAAVPFPLADPEQVVEAVLAKAGDRTRLALVDHVTSPTGLVFPVERVVRHLRERGIETLVDGAHGPGMMDLDVERLGAAYYVGNFHKWVCAPKGAAMLWVRRDRHAGLHPNVISHGYEVAETPSRLHAEFDWTGTDDPTPWLCVPEAIEHVGSLVAGGWPEIRERNRALVLRGREILTEALGLPAPAPDSMIGMLAAVPLPPSSEPPSRSPLYLDPMQTRLLERRRIEVPIPGWPRPPRRVIRISAHLYNHEHEYRTLAAALREELGDRP